MSRGVAVQVVVEGAGGAGGRVADDRRQGVVGVDRLVVRCRERPRLPGEEREHVALPRPGDGIGPEVAVPALEVADHARGHADLRGHVVDLRPAERGLRRVEAVLAGARGDERGEARSGRPARDGSGARGGRRGGSGRRLLAHLLRLGLGAGRPGASGGRAAVRGRDLGGLTGGSPCRGGLVDLRLGCGRGLVRCGLRRARLRSGLMVALRLEGPGDLPCGPLGVRLRLGGGERVELALACLEACGEVGDPLLEGRLLGGDGRCVRQGQPARAGPDGEDGDREEGGDDRRAEAGAPAQTGRGPPLGV